MSQNEHIEIAQKIFWVGNGKKYNELTYNSYLLIDEECVVLVDPGPVCSFAEIRENIEKIIPFNSIQYIILQNVSPGVCGSLSIFLHEFPKITLIVHDRAKSLLESYNYTNPLFLIDEQVSKLTLPSGREINFIETPYLPYFESFMTFWKYSKILFSSTIFGATPYRWKLYADTILYSESMKSFHERYIPGNRFLRPVMEILAKMHKRTGIQTIAPHHGSIINTEIEHKIDVLKDLACGILFNPIKNEITRKEGYIWMSNNVLSLYFDNFEKSEVEKIFANSDIEFDPLVGKILEYPGTGEQLWNKFFNLVYSVHGAKWVGIAYNKVLTFEQQYHILRPAVFNVREHEIIKIEVENMELKEQIDKLEVELSETSEKIIRDQITNLHNETFFRNFVRTLISKNVEAHNFTIIIIEVDSVWQIKKKFGQEGNEKIIRMLQILADFLKKKASEKGYQLFKMTAEGSFSLYIPADDLAMATNFSDSLRNEIRISGAFQQPITLSASIVSSSEFGHEAITENLILLVAYTRLGIAKSRGIDQVCNHSEIEKVLRKKILIIDTDEVYIEMIKSALEQWNYEIKVQKNSHEAIDYIHEKNPELVIAEYELDTEILTASDGLNASSIIESQKPNLVISEYMIPKDNGLVVRERMLQISSSKNIPFILLSHLKDENTIQRAINMKVDYFLKKPFYMVELLGIVNNLLNR